MFHHTACRHSVEDSGQYMQQLHLVSAGMYPVPDIHRQHTDLEQPYLSIGNYIPWA